MAFKLFVGGLPYATTSDELKEAFAAFGDVESAAVITDRETGRSKGYGFVEFVNDEDGKKAQAALDGSQFGGRTITVSEARPQGERPRRDFGGNGGGRSSGGYGGGDNRRSSW